MLRKIMRSCTDTLQKFGMWGQIICHILYILYKNQKLIFPFFISCNFIFPLLNALVYVDILKRFSRQFIWPHFLNFWRVLISRSQKQKLTVPRFRKSGISNLISVPRWSSNRPRCICFSPSYKSENVHAKIAIFFLKTGFICGKPRIYTIN